MGGYVPYYFLPDNPFRLQGVTTSGKEICCVWSHILCTTCPKCVCKMCHSTVCIFSQHVSHHFVRASLPVGDFTPELPLSLSSFVCFVVVITTALHCGIYPICWHSVQCLHTVIFPWNNMLIVNYWFCTNVSDMVKKSTYWTGISDADIVGHRNLLWS